MRAGGYTGKLSWNFGKKYGSSLMALSSLPREDDNDETSDDGAADTESFHRQCEEFWKLLEVAANRLISTSTTTTTTVQKYDLRNETAALEAATQLGNGILDAGQVGAREKRLKKRELEKKKMKMAKAENGAEEADDDDNVDDGPPVSLGCISTTTTTNASSSTPLILALLHGSELITPLSNLGYIKILRSDPKTESNIVCNKKKCELTVKFCVLPPTTMADGGEKGNVAVAAPTSSSLAEIDITRCMSREIRLEEGLQYQLYMKEQMQLKELAKMEKLELVDDPPTTTTDNNNVPNTTENNTDDDMVVTAFEVSGSIDYTKLIEKFGSKPLTPYLLRRLENVTVKRGTVPRLHRFLRREIFFSHRDIEKICELLEGWYGVSPPSPDESDDQADVEGSAQPQQQEQPKTPCPIYLYTGRGPSSAAMHLGHLVPFLFTAWLQKAFQCPLVIQMTDDEKFIFKGEYNGDDSGDAGGDQTGDGGGGDATNNEGTADDNRTGDNLDYFAKLTIENAKDIIACDFIYDKTFLFSDLEYVGKMYPNIVRIWKAVTINQVNGIFGFDGTSNIGKAAFPAIQAAPSFGSSFPVVLGGRETVNAATLACLIPCAIDQDPYFRLTRDVAHKLVPRRHPLRGKPALIHSKFFPPLQGAKGKMSSSDPNSAIFLTDTDQEIERKIKVHAFSGGRETKVLQMELGANLDVDVSYQWLRFFLEDDDELARIGHEYGTGSGEFWSTGSVKAKLVQVLKELVKEHQDRRDKVTDEVVRKWMSERCIA